MSVTHPNTAFAPSSQEGFVGRHPQVAPALVAVAIFVISVAVSLAFTGLPS